MAEQDVGRIKRSSIVKKYNHSMVLYMRHGSCNLQKNEQLYSTSVGVHFVNDLKSASKAMDIAKILVFIERLCDNSDSSREPFEYSLSMSLPEVLERPHICCERTPIGWNEDPFFERNNNLDVLKQGYCRSITHFADFVAVSPELYLLEMKDRLSVCSTNYCGVFLLMMVYNAYLNNYEGILFPHGFRYSLSQKREDPEFNEFLQDLVEYLYTNVATVFQEIQVTAEEYALLKSIVIFSGVMNLTDVGSSIVLRARRKYSALLSEYVVATQPDLSPSEQMMRLTRLFGIIPYMMHASDRYNMYSARMVLMNIGNIAGSLSYDLHVRKF
uniref:NR LBD domain-containing protein n=1 Tax=Haemonchus contortus TaxID=6289 RepID=A0A7I4YNU5_HAECO